jgi:hypothetical protein
MSTELLLLLFFFLVLPLLQRLLGAASPPEPETPERARHDMEAPEHAPRPRTPAVPRPVETARHRLAEAVASKPTRVPIAAGPAAPAAATRRSTRRRAVVAGLRHPRGLRRAIVLMTILGPCRANQR